MRRATVLQYTTCAFEAYRIMSSHDSDDGEMSLGDVFTVSRISYPHCIHSTRICARRNLLDRPLRSLPYQPTPANAQSMGTIGQRSTYASSVRTLSGAIICTWCAFLPPLDESDACGRRWNASLAFASYLDDHPELYRDRHVLELGAGGALPGIVAAKNGAKRVGARRLRVNFLAEVFVFVNA